MMQFYCSKNANKKIKNKKRIVIYPVQAEYNKVDTIF